MELCCEGPLFTSIQEDECDKGAHQSCLGAERSTLVNPNWFQPCQCCCFLCYPGEYLGLGTLISYNLAQVFEACDCLKLLSIHIDLCVDDHPILRRKVEAAVQSLKKGKSEDVITAFTTICDKIWQKGKWPAPWTLSSVITLSKKGNL